MPKKIPLKQSKTNAKLIIVDLGLDRVIVLYSNPGDMQFSLTEIPIEVRTTNSKYVTNNFITTSATNVPRKMFGKRTSKVVGTQYRNHVEWGRVIYEKTPSGQYRCLLNPSQRDQLEDPSDYGTSSNPLLYPWKAQMTQSEIDTEVSNEMLIQTSAGKYAWIGNQYGPNAIEYQRIANEVKQTGNFSNFMLHGNSGPFELPTDAYPLSAGTWGHGCIRMSNIGIKWLHGITTYRHRQYYIIDQSVIVNMLAPYDIETSSYQRIFSHVTTSLTYSRTVFTGEPWAVTRTMASHNWNNP